MIAKSKAKKPSSTVTGRRWISRVVTGTDVLIDAPRSPWAIFPM